MASEHVALSGDRQLYKSFPLPADQGSEYIHVLQLRNDTKDAPLAGTLEVASLDRVSGPKFSALSYVWGQYQSPAHIITCSGHELRITASCHNALQALRELHDDLRIWVDAICIDQENNKEKEKQIPLMPKIYRNASPVYIWLGQGNTLFSQALKIVGIASRLEETAKRYDAMKTPPIHPSAWTFTNLLRLRRNIRELEKMAEDAGTTIEQIDLDCEWLHRAWTIQELMFSTSAAFLWGTTQISRKQMTGIWYFRGSPRESGSQASSLKHAFGDEKAAMTFLKGWSDMMSQWSYSWISELSTMFGTGLLAEVSNGFEICNPLCRRC